MLEDTARFVVDVNRGSANRLRQEADILDTAADDLEAVIPPPNQVPNSLKLTIDEISEDVEIGTAVALITAVDPDGDPLTFTALADNFGVRNGNEVFVTNPLDAETIPVEEIIVTVSDGKDSVTESLFITVLPTVVVPPPPPPSGLKLHQVAELLSSDESIEWPGTSIGPIALHAKAIQDPVAPGNIFHTIVWGGQAEGPDGSIYMMGSGHAGYSGIEVFRFKDGQWSLFRGNWKTESGPDDHITSKKTRPRTPERILNDHNPEGPFWGVRYPWPDNNQSPAGVHVYGGLFCDSKGRLWRVGGGGVYSGVTKTPFVWVTDTNDPDGWWEPRTAYAGGLDTISGIEELEDGRLFFLSGAGGYIYDPEVDSIERGEVSKQIFFDYWRLRDQHIRLDARFEDGSFGVTEEQVAEARTAYRAKRDEISEFSLTSFNGVPAPYMWAAKGGGGPDSIVQIPGGKIIVMAREGRHRVLDNGVEWPMRLTGEIPRDEVGGLLLDSTGLVYDKKRDVVWMWSTRAKEFMHAAKLVKTDEGYDLDVVQYPLDKFPERVRTPYENIRIYAATAQGRLIYNEELDVLWWYASVNQGFFVYRPPEVIRDSVPFVREPKKPEDPTNGPWEVSPTQGAPVIDGDYRVSLDETDTSETTYRTFKELNSRVDLTGKKVVFSPGHHERVSVSKPVHLVGEPGAWLGSLWPFAGGVGVDLRLGADGTIVEGFGFDRCLRGINTNDVITGTVRNCQFRESTMHIQFHSAGKNPDNEAGIGEIVIEDCIGFETRPGQEFAHNIYLSGGLGGHAIVRRNLFVAAAGGGIGIKVGTSSSLIEDNVIDMLDRNGSLSLDIVKGGQHVSRGNTYRQSANGNTEMFTLAVSTRRERGGVWNPQPQSFTSENDTFEYHGSVGKSALMFNQSNGTIEFINPTLVGIEGGFFKVDDKFGVSQVWDGVSIEDRRIAPVTSLSDNPNVTITGAVILPEGS